MSATGVRLQVKNLQKSWGNLSVLDGIDFDIKAGTFLTLLGPSGCGKSTALRLIAGLDKVSGGSIMVDGEDVTNLGPGERNIGMVFQNYALFPHMSVKQNILYGMKVRKAPADLTKRNLERVVDLMGLGPLLDRLPSQLSGGQQQRVALARVLVADRPLVLMDEPLSNLDAKLRVEIRSEIRELNKKLGITIVYVTHDQSEALSMSDKVLLMNGGKAVQFGTPSEIYSDPQDVFAASFIGTPPMNLLPCGLIDTAVLEQLEKSPSELLVGLRPEDLSLSTDGNKSSMKGRVISSEYEGVHTLTTVELEQSQKVIVTVPKSESYAQNSEVFVEVPKSSVHFFTKDDGQRMPV